MDGSGVTEVEAPEGAHPALRKFAHVLHTLEDCSKELKGIVEVVVEENLVFARSAWREELHLVAVHALERLTQLMQAVQADLSLGVALPPASDGKALRVESEGLRRESHVQRWCPHVCEAHHEMMDPVLWSKLPEYLVELIFARLPLRDVVQLQSVSKAWRYAVRMSTPFHRFRGPRFALVTSNQSRDCKIHFCDVKENKWWLKTMDAVSYGFWASPVIASGGLLCIVDLHQLSYGALSISVCNPLTNTSRVLPPLSHFNRLFPKMMQLVVDNSTRHYKLLVVGSWHRAPETLTMEVYDSQIGSWASSSDVNPAPGTTYRDSATSVCGYDFSYDGQYEGIVRYDTRAKSLYQLVFPSHPNMVQPPTKNEIAMHGGEVWAVVGTLRNQEALYKLCTDALRGTAEWVPQDDGASTLVSFPRTYYKRVLMAGSLVLVAADNRERADLNHHQILMLRDLASGERWIQLPKLGQAEKCDMWKLNHAVMMELRWDATP